MVAGKFYDESDEVISSTATKVKGVALTDVLGNDTRVLDDSDYVIPPQVGFCRDEFPSALS